MDYEGVLLPVEPRGRQQLVTQTPEGGLKLQQAILVGNYSKQVKDKLE